MNRAAPFRLLALVLLTIALPACVQRDYLIRSAEYRNPGRFENDIKKFEAADEKQMPPTGAVLCVGSSSIRMWHGKLAQDLAPLTVIPRGFGGSNTNDLLHFADRIVLKYKPRAILIYEGDNDVAQGVAPEVIVKTFEKLLDKIHTSLPDCRIYILAVKPSPLRWDNWWAMKRVNEALAEIAEDEKNVTFIDTATPMLGDDGKPRPELFVADNLHLNRAGYELWRDVVRPILVEQELRFEQAVQD